LQKQAETAFSDIEKYRESEKSLAGMKSKRVKS